MKRKVSSVIMNDAILWQFILLSKNGRFILITGQEGGQGKEGRLGIRKQEFRKYYHYYYYNPEKQKKMKKDIVTRTYLTTNCIFTE